MMKKELFASGTGLALSVAVMAGCSGSSESPGYNESFPPSTPTPTTLAESPVQITNKLDTPLDVTNIPNTYYGPENDRGKVGARQAVMAFCVEVSNPAAPAVYVQTADRQYGYVSYLTASSAKPGTSFTNEGLPQLAPDLSTLQSKLPDC